MNENLMPLRDDTLSLVIAFEKTRASLATLDAAVPEAERIEIGLAVGDAWSAWNQHARNLATDPATLEYALVNRLSDIKDASFPFSALLDLFAEGSEILAEIRATLLKTKGTFSLFKHGPASSIANTSSMGNYWLRGG